MRRPIGNRQRSAPSTRSGGLDHPRKRAAIQHEFAADLEFAALLAKRVFLGKFLFRTVPQGMVHFMQKSPRFRELMQDLFSGTQSYSGLRTRLLKNLNGTLQEVIMQFFLDHVIPQNSRVKA